MWCETEYGVKSNGCLQMMHGGSSPRFIQRRKPSLSPMLLLTLLLRTAVSCSLLLPPEPKLSGFFLFMSACKWSS